MTKLADLLRDPLEGAPIGLPIRRASLVAVALTWVYMVSVMPSGFYPTWFSWVAGAGLLVPVLCGLLAWRSAQWTLVWMQALIAIAALLRVVEAAVIVQPEGRADYSPFSVTFALVAGFTGLAFGPRLGVPLVVASLGALMSERIEVVGSFQAAGEAVVLGAGASIGFLVAREVLRGLGAVRDAVDQTIERRSRAILAAERIGLNERWDALVHDTILASLRLGSRGEPISAAVAAEALAELSGVEVGAKDALAEVRALIRRLGLQVDVHVQDGWPEGPSGEALLVAVAEALNNVARHSGQRSARIDSQWSGTTVRVKVSDPGRGFEPSKVAARRLGLRQVIAGSMKSVGGEAEVTSAPGLGTVVRLTVDTAPSAHDSHPMPGWRLGSRRWIAALVAAHLAGSVAVGIRFLPETVIPGVALAGLVAVPTITVLVAVLPVRSSWWPVLMGAIVVTWSALWINLLDPGNPDWRTWFVGGFNAALILIVIRDRLRQALLLVGLSTAIAVAGLLIRGEQGFGYAMLQSTQQTVMWPLLASFFARFMNSASRSIAQEQARSAEIETERQITQARDEELVRRRLSLDDEVVPMLRRLAAGEVLDEQERRRCAELESATRDQLVAGPVLEPVLVQQIAEARRRGARVSITGSVEPGADLEAFRQSSSELLAQARSGDRVQLTWRSGRSGLGPTMSLVGEGVGRTWADPPLAGGAEVSLDDDSVLIALVPQATAPAMPSVSWASQGL